MISQKLSHQPNYSTNQKTETQTKKERMQNVSVNNPPPPTSCNGTGRYCYCVDFVVQWLPCVHVSQYVDGSNPLSDSRQLFLSFPTETAGHQRHHPVLFCRNHHVTYLTAEQPGASGQLPVICSVLADVLLVINFRKVIIFKLCATVWPLFSLLPS